MASQRIRALALYKDLIRIGKDYPDPNYSFQGRMRRLFESGLVSLQHVLIWIDPLLSENKDLKEEAEIAKAIELGEYIKKGTHVLRLLSFSQGRSVPVRY